MYHNKQHATLRIVSYVRSLATCGKLSNKNLIFFSRA